MNAPDVWQQLVTVLDYESLVWLFALLCVLSWVGNAVIQTARRNEAHWSYRIAFGVFLTWMGRGIARDGIPDGAYLLLLTLRSLVVAGLANALCCIIFPMVTFCWDEVFSGTIHSIFQGWGQHWQDRRDQAQRARELRQQEKQRQEAQPRDEQWAREQEIEQQRQLRQEELEHSRREAKALELRLLYDRYRKELEGKLGPDEFEAYFQSFLTHEISAATYETRAEQVASMICELATPPSNVDQPEFSELEDIVKHYHQQLQSVRQMPHLDEDTRETLICLLEESRDRALEEFLK